MNDNEPLEPNVPSFDDFIAYLNRERAIAPIRKSLIADCREASCYDLGDLMAHEEGVALAVSLMAERMDENHVLTIEAVGPFLFRWSAGQPGVFVFGYTGGRANPLICFFDDNGFILNPERSRPLGPNGEFFMMEGNNNSATDGMVCAALALIDEAEANNGENVEFVERPERGAVGKQRRLRRQKNHVRTISLTATRKQYLCQRGDHKGGTHARPCEHVRVLTRRLIEPKNRNPYWREAKVITVNPGVQRVTKVVL